MKTSGGFHVNDINDNQSAASFQGTSAPARPQNVEDFKSYGDAIYNESQVGNPEEHSDSFHPRPQNAANTVQPPPWLTGKADNKSPQNPGSPAATANPGHVTAGSFYATVKNFTSKAPLQKPAAPQSSREPESRRSLNEEPRDVVSTGESTPPPEMDQARIIQLLIEARQRQQW